MGVNAKTFNDLINVIDNYVTDSRTKTFIELGKQETWGTMDIRYIRDVLDKSFASYLSVDLHQEENITVFDLSKHNPNMFSADILTNFGTSEHVEYEDGQYNCWKNIHDWVNVGGISLHDVPLTGYWKNHCRYFYTDEFFKEFEKFGYKILDLRHQDSWGDPLIWCVLQKTEHKEFMSFETFKNLITIDYDTSSNIIAGHNNPKKLSF
jgi:hypothetical protein